MKEGNDCLFPHGIDCHPATTSRPTHQLNPKYAWCLTGHAFSILCSPSCSAGFWQFKIKIIKKYDKLMVWGGRRLPWFGTHPSIKRKGKMSPCRILVKSSVTPHFLKAAVILLLLLLEILIQRQFLSANIGRATSGNAASKDSRRGK